MRRLVKVHSRLGNSRTPYCAQAPGLVKGLVSIAGSARGGERFDSRGMGTVASVRTCAGTFPCLFVHGTHDKNVALQVAEHLYKVRVLPQRSRECSLPYGYPTAMTCQASVARCQYLRVSVCLGVLYAGDKALYRFGNTKSVRTSDKHAFI